VILVSEHTGSTTY